MPAFDTYDDETPWALEAHEAAQLLDVQVDVFAPEALND